MQEEGGRVGNDQKKACDTVVCAFGIERTFITVGKHELPYDRILALLVSS